MRLRRRNTLNRVFLLAGAVTSFFLSACSPKGVEERNLSDKPPHGAVARLKEEAMRQIYLASANVVFLPEPMDVVTVGLTTYGEPLPNSKDDGALPVWVALSIGTEDGEGSQFSTWGTIKVQGSSTAGFPKKNWTLRLFADREREELLKLRIGDSIASDEWILKAEWIDPSQLRNMVTYRLWEQMVAARPNYPLTEVRPRSRRAPLFVPAQYGRGFPWTFPAVVSVNNEHYGLATLTMGHDPANFNIDPERSDHMYFEFDSRGGKDPAKSWGKFKFENEGHLENYLSEAGDFTVEELESIDRLGIFINGPQSSFDADFDDFLDEDNMVDMLLLIEATYDWDGVAQDLEIVTYDGQRWYFLPWDKDTTFGLNWDGSGIIAGSETSLVIDYKTAREDQLPWHRTYRAKKQEVESRYAELRNSGVFTTENVENIVADLEASFPFAAREEEYAKWAPLGRPSIEEATPSQISSWFSERLTMLDSHFNFSAN